MISAGSIIGGPPMLWASGERSFVRVKQIRRGVSIPALKFDCSVPVSFQNIALETDALSDLPALFHQNFRIDRDPYLTYRVLLPFALFCQTRNSSLFASSKANKAPNFKLFSHFFQFISLKI
ncbi:hypothetical protein AAC387_Pa05g2661 [Persea americana]